MSHVLAFLPGWFWHPLGQCAGHGAEVVRCKSYNLWSGTASDVSELAIFGGLVVFYRRHNCHQHRCWRLSWHPDKEGHPVCRVHHPDHPSSSGLLARAFTKLLVTVRGPAHHPPRDD